MALLSAPTERKTKLELETWSGYNNIRQMNTRVQVGLDKGLTIMAMDTEQTKQELIQLALFDFLSAHGYLDRTVEVK